MMRRLLLALLIGLYAAPLAADDSPPFRVQVRFESVFVRAAPTLDAEPVASIYEDEWLDAVGRSLDGLWYEVRRPYRLSNLGWVLAEMVEWDFAPERLPLTEFAPGLVADPGAAIFLLENTTVRQSPLLEAPRVTVIPHSTTLPVLARNQNATWVQVYYQGSIGWVSVFGARDLLEPLTIPQAANLPPLQGPQIIIIPPEIQLAQVERARVFLDASRMVSDGLAGFWFSVSNGNIMPCQPPPFVEDYLVNTQDIRELPEIQRYLPQMTDAVALLNDAIDPLYICGPLDVRAVTKARNSAINATGMFDAVLERLDNLEENVIR